MTTGFGLIDLHRGCCHYECYPYGGRCGCCHHRTSWCNWEPRGGGGGSSNLQRFEPHDPLALIGEGDPMVVGPCFLVV